jgi:hypothetical protein
MSSASLLILSSSYTLMLAISPEFKIKSGLILFSSHHCAVFLQFSWERWISDTSRIVSCCGDVILCQTSENRRKNLIGYRKMDGFDWLVGSVIISIFEVELMCPPAFK